MGSSWDLCMLFCTKLAKTDHVVPDGASDVAKEHSNLTLRLYVLFLVLLKPG